MPPFLKKTLILLGVILVILVVAALLTGDADYLDFAYEGFD